MHGRGRGATLLWGCRMTGSFAKVPCRTGFVSILVAWWAKSCGLARLRGSDGRRRKVQRLRALKRQAPSPSNGPVALPRTQRSPAVACLDVAGQVGIPNNFVLGG